MAVLEPRVGIVNAAPFFGCDSFMFFLRDWLIDLTNLTRKGDDSSRSHERVVRLLDQTPRGQWIHLDFISVVVATGRSQALALLSDAHGSASHSILWQPWFHRIVG